MIFHFFKLVWNKKNSYVFLILQLFFAHLVISFLVIFLFLTASYHFKTTGFSTDNLIMINATDSTGLRHNISSIKEVQSITETNIIPYNNIVTNDTLKYHSNVKRVYSWKADENLYETLKLSMRSGRWFTKEDRFKLTSSVVIDETLAMDIFGNTEMTGKIVKIGTKEYSIVGIVENLNDPSGNYKNRPDVFVFEKASFLLVKLRKPMDNDIYKQFKSMVPNPSSNLGENIIPISYYREQFTSKSKSMTIVMGFLSGFLTLNVILGLFAILNQSINKRKAEFGLRRAIGAPASLIYNQVIIEMVLITSISIALGIVVGSQFAIFKVFGSTAYYYTSMLLAALIIYFLVIICTIYPAYLASKIKPARALQNNL